MNLLNNKRDWKKWAKDFNASQPQVGAAAEPMEFPCFVYETVRSFGYEETSENYLYRSDIESMLNQLNNP